MGGPGVVRSAVLRDGIGAMFSDRVGRSLMLFSVCDFLPINHYLAGCMDADPNLMAVDGDDRDLNVISDVQNLANIARQDQHESCSRAVRARSRGRSVIGNDARL